MFGPTARTTPTRLPWWWMLLAVWLLMALWSPAFAAGFDAEPQPAAAASEPLRLGRWQLLGLNDMLRAVQYRADAATPRMLPLAVMPMQRSAWWLGLSTAHADGVRVELRWTMALDGRTPALQLKGP